MLELAYAAPHQVVRYIARQSWCSIGNVVATPLLRTTKLSSPFQDRSFQGDLSGNALDQIQSAAEAHPDASLLMDLTDERGGFYAGPDGEIVTHNSDAAPSGIYTRLPAGWQHVAFGSLPYALAFATAADQLKLGLQEINLWQRTKILGNLWAETGTDTSYSPAHTLRAKRMNPLLDECYSFLESEGWNVVRPHQTKLPIADTNHKWGPAPFHYSLDSYEIVAASIGLGTT